MEQNQPCPHCSAPLYPGESCAHDPALQSPPPEHFETGQKRVRSFEIVDHGPECSSYFRGCGTAFSDFEDVSTGIGHSAAEALEDALESLAQGGWEFSDALEAEALEELGSKEDRERDVISPLEEEAEEEALEPLSFRVSFRAWSGCSPPREEHSEREDARDACARILRSRRSAGFPVSVLERGSAWEVLEPDECFMIPDDCGTLSLSDNAEEREDEREHMRDSYPSELYYFLSVRVSAEEV